jgi:ppGpp synthetase/RelA/SpoT-type nucleotidyltranferase
VRGVLHQSAKFNVATELKTPNKRPVLQWFKAEHPSSTYVRFANYRKAMSKLKQKTGPNEQPHTPWESVEDIWQRSPETVRRFLDLRRDNEQLCAEIEYILRKKLAKQAIETSAVMSRAKTLNSFLEKLQRKQYSQPLEEITDLAGARVVCIYRSDVAKVAEIVREEFEVTEDTDKLDEMGVDQFGYEARHFLVRLGKGSSGARYDDLKQLVCEIQVRTVVQDAWAIIQHHLVYKNEAQVPKQIQRKLNSLAAIFENADDQFENIRKERESYIAGVRETARTPGEFLRNELNLDSFTEYLRATFPDRPTAYVGDKGALTLDGLRKAGLKTLRDLETLLKETAESREKLKELLVQDSWKRDGALPSETEPTFALAVSAVNWKELLPWEEGVRNQIEQFRQLHPRLQT